jgi:hypothetical protein
LNKGHDGDVWSNSTITINGNGTIIDGDATAYTAINQGTGTITGLKQIGIPLPAVTPVPDCSTNAPTNGYSDGSGISGNATYTAQHELRISNDEEARLAAPGDYCFKSITMNGSSTLRVPAGNCADSSPYCVRIYLTDNSNLSGGIANDTLQAKNLQIFSSCDTDQPGPQCTLTMGGGGDAYVVASAPLATINYSSTGGNLFGALIGKHVNVSGAFAYHYDEALGGVTLLAPTLIGWREVR